MGKIGDFQSILIVIINYLKSDLIKKQRSFKIGLISIFLVVFFLTLLLNAIQLSPCIFIKISEEQKSEIDLILTPYLSKENVDTKKPKSDNFIYNKTSVSESLTSKYKFNYNFLNFYEIKNRLKRLSFIEGVTPRWAFQGKTLKVNGKGSSPDFLTNVFVINSERETDIGIGRSLNLIPLKKNECYISTTLANAFQLNIGDSLELNIRLWDLFNAFDGGKFFKNEKKEEAKKSIIDRIKLKKKYEKEDKENDNIYNRDFYYNIFDPETDFKIGNNFFESSKYNNFKNLVLNSKPIKEIINIIGNEYINRVINENINLLVTLGNLYFNTSINLKDLSSFYIKKKDLKKLTSLFGISDLYNLINLNQIYPKFNLNSNLLKYISNLIINQTFIYNETTDIIKFNKDVLNFSPTGKIKNYFKYNIDFNKILKEYNGEESNLFFDRIFQLINFKINLTVKEKIKPSSGKWPSVSGNALAIDSNHISYYLKMNGKRLVNEITEKLNIKNTRNIIIDYMNRYLNRFDINKYAFTINVIFKDKFNIYNKDSINIKYYISNKVSEIINSLGRNQMVNIESPLLDNFKLLDVVRTFLQVILFGIMAFLWILSVLLVYSLMLGNVDERTYESSMLRALGFQKNDLIILIIIQGLIFAIPGSILGLISSYISNNFVAYLFYSYTKLVMPSFMSKSNLIFGIVIGISIPLISSYFPIKKVLNSNLKENLSFFNKKISEIVIIMIKLENIGISTSSLIISITLITIGILTYYVGPLSFLFLNSRLFLFIMLGILMAILIGLIVLTQILVPYLQKFILKIIMFLSFKDRNLHLLVSKNLEGHNRRDQQVSLIFMIAIGFIIFSGCTLNLVVDFIETLAKSVIAGDTMVLLLMNQNDFNTTLNQTLINGYLNNISKIYPNTIQDYAYISLPTHELLHTPVFEIYPRVCALNSYPRNYRASYGIDRNYIDSSYTSLYSISQYDKNLNVSYTNDGKVDIIKMLYDNPNVPPVFEEKEDFFIFPNSQELKSKYKEIFKDFQINMIASEGIRKQKGISIDNPGMFKVPQIYEHNIPSKVIGMAKKLPGIFSYSSYYSIAEDSEVYISMDHMKKLFDVETKFFNKDMGDYSNSTIDGIRKLQFILKYKENASEELKQLIYYGLYNHLNGIKYIIFKLDDVIETSEKVKFVISHIFLVLGIIALILSFFLIWISFYSNIRENINNYGIMRSIGVTKSQSLRIYLYEAATIILGSIITGTIIGIIISCSLILQFDIFLELPFIFHFPFKLYIILNIVGLTLGMLGSYYPIHEVNSLTLTKIMKGFNE